MHHYRKSLGIAAVLAALLLAACTSGSSDPTEEPGGADPTSAATDTPAPAPTEAAADPTEEPEDADGPFSPYLDSENDCFKNSDLTAAPVCMPPDIESVTVTRSSPVTIVVVFRVPPQGFEWQLTLGLDLDSDPSTGINEGLFADVLGIGPDVEADYFASGGDDGPLAQAYQVDPGPTYNLLEIGAPGDGQYVTWTWNDERTLQAVFQDMVIPASATTFYVGGFSMDPDYHDPFPDPEDGPLAYGP